MRKARISRCSIALSPAWFFWVQSSFSFCLSVHNYFDYYVKIASIKKIFVTCDTTLKERRGLGFVGPGLRLLPVNRLAGTCLCLPVSARVCPRLSALVRPCPRLPGPACPVRLFSESLFSRKIFLSIMCAYVALFAYRRAFTKKETCLRWVRQRRR